MSEDRLLNCPFCGSSEVDATGWASQESAGPACDECGGSCGTATNDPEQNIAAWNTRAPVVIDDAMVERYCVAVNEYLGSLSEAQWAEDRKNHASAIRRVARIGLQAALNPQEKPE